MRRATGAMVLLTAIAIVVVARTLPRRMAPVASSAVVEHVVFIALAVCAGVVATGVAWIAGRGGNWIIAAATAAVGLSVVAGSARFPLVSGWTTVVVNVCWLGSSAAGCGTLARALSGERARFRPGHRIVLGALVATALCTAALDRGVGLGSTLGPLSKSGVPAIARVALGVHCAVLALGGLWLVTDAGRAQRGARIGQRRPMLLVGLAWLATAVVERAIPVLPVHRFRDLERDVYQPWAFLVGAKVPLLGYVALLVAVGWMLVTMPPRTATGRALVLRDIDPFETLRQDMAAWLGDPTIELVFADDDGNWRPRAGWSPAESGTYDRRTTVLTRDGHPVAGLIHDVDVARAPESLATAAALAGLALDANRLVAASEARLAQAQELSGRLLWADSATRADLLGELDAGPLARLRQSADRLQRGAPVAEVVDELCLAASEVRELSHGTYPPELVDGGVRAALPGVAGVPHRRLPRSIELTAYLLARDAEFVEFEDRGDVVRVRRQGPALPPGVSDRLAVLGATADADVIELPIGVATEVLP